MSILLDKSTGNERGSDGQRDRRRSTREAVATVGCLRTPNDTREGGRQVLVTDVSLHGVGMRTTFPLQEDEIFSIEIGVGPLHLASRLRVVRSRPLPDGTFDIGGEFF
jgi:hypothetical protein